MKKEIAILTGGKSSERDVALNSAQVIADQLKEHYSVSIFDLPMDLELFISKYKQIDVAIPVFHGKGGEDGTIQGFLKILGIPFIFSDVEAHAISLDKAQTKRIVAYCGITTPDFRSVNKNENVQYEYPCVIKPMNGGSSIGISIAQSEMDFQKGLMEAFVYSETVLIEKYISGEEYTVAIIEEHAKPIALPVIQVKSKRSFFDYKSKYDSDLVDEICPAQISDQLSHELQELGLKIHTLVGARHISRSDFIVSPDGKIWFLEINTIPGQTLQSLVPKAIHTSGRSFAVLLNEWIEEVALKK